MTYKEGSNDFGAIWQSWYGLVNSANAAVIALTNLDVKLYPRPKQKRLWSPRPDVCGPGLMLIYSGCSDTGGKPTTVLMVFYTAIRCPIWVICRFPDHCRRILSENFWRFGTGVEVFTRFYYSPLFIETIGTGIESEVVIEPGSDARWCTGLERCAGFGAYCEERCSG